MRPLSLSGLLCLVYPPLPDDKFSNIVQVNMDKRVQGGKDNGVLGVYTIHNRPDKYSGNLPMNPGK